MCGLGLGFKTDVKVLVLNLSALVEHR